MQHMQIQPFLSPLSSTRRQASTVHSHKKKLHHSLCFSFLIAKAKKGTHTQTHAVRAHMNMSSNGGMS